MDPTLEIGAKLLLYIETKVQGFREITFIKLMVVELF